ncbi:DUF2243 domain-containing protein [Paenibacillus sp. DMB20]|uniref:DUF2243 domain-containing protein n=1 Tax=Paenibacillus sp. DMB20 TaxID=1642570 RepID=UPI00062828E8|nr:DUF2243 domain-containing protein [Paenibacillus sp. DMB20]KKO55184.1 hypothetical protein XI25_02165 [Paenibacillus sp. DMB20]
MEQSVRRTRWGGFILGLGIMGSLDGIIFHQILQWHSVYMETDRHGKLLSDGLFHIAATLLMIWGALLLWQADKPRKPYGMPFLLGWIFIGGGVFNFTEGLINHQILQVHHVKPGDPNELAYDLAFLASGLIMAGIGLWLRRPNNASAQSLKA